MVFRRTPRSGNDQSCIEINVVTFCLQFCCYIVSCIGYFTKEDKDAILKIVPAPN